MTFFDFGEIIDNETTEFVVFGIPWDFLTSTPIANSAIAPQKIREVTSYLALSTELGVKIPDLKVVDIGDISIVQADVKGNLKNIGDFISNIYLQKKDVILVMMGGDHFCTYPVVKAVVDHLTSKEQFGVLVFDAHLDFYEQWDKGTYSHATVSHRILDLNYINNKNLLIVGTRDVDFPELELAHEEQLKFFPAHELIEKGLNQYIHDIVEFYQENKITDLYVSIDIDVLDPSIAPATGYAIPGGFTYREFWVMLKILSENFNVIGFDLVETSPNLDLPNLITSNLSAKLIIEFISFIKNNK